MKLIAGAGTGKTSTLKLIADAMEPGLGAYYIAFNKVIVQESKGKFPSHVQCSTIHSIAWNSAQGGKVTWKVKGGVRQPSYRECAEKLGMVDPNLPVRFEKGTDDFVEIFPTTMARLAHEAVGRWCQSPDRQVEQRHCFNRIPGLDLPGEFTNARLLADRILPMAQQIAEDWMNPSTHRFRTTHAAYLKRWFDHDPILATEVLLVDEAQDLNPLMLHIVERNRACGAQVVLVGDPAQQIYAWNGAVDSMGKIDTDHTVYLTESFRFGEYVAARANETLEAFAHPTRIVGSGPEGGHFDDHPSIVLGRTNVGVVGAALTYLEMGLDVGMQGGTAEIVRFARAAGDLMIGKRTDHHELCAFKNWDEVKETVKKGDDGGELGTFVRLVEEYGVSTLVNRLQACGDPVQARSRRFDVIVGTAHKSKGGEWPKVRLLDDWPKEPSIEDMRLLYVAQTRAQVGLDDFPVAYRVLESYDHAGEVA